MTPEEFALEFGDDENHTIYYSILCLFGSYSQCEVSIYQKSLPECRHYNEYDKDGYNYDPAECVDGEQYYENDGTYPKPKHRDGN